MVLGSVSFGVANSLGTHVGIFGSLRLSMRKDQSETGDGSGVSRNALESIRKPRSRQGISREDRRAQTSITSTTGVTSDFGKRAGQ